MVVTKVAEVSISNLDPRAVFFARRELSTRNPPARPVAVFARGIAVFWGYFREYSEPVCPVCNKLTRGNPLCSTTYDKH